MRDEALQSLRELNEVVERLRAPGGCPWDREQTHLTLRPYLLEETYEVLEAIESRGHGSLREELGDLLLQVLMHSAIAMEDPEEGFDIGGVADVTRRKMVHRHPHVFADTDVSGADEVVVNWERLKAAEKSERLSILDGVPRALPALAFALGMQKRPARVGFDQIPTLGEAMTWVGEALQAVEERAADAAATAPAPPAASGGWVASGEAGFVRVEPEAEGGPQAAPPPTPGTHAAPPVAAPEVEAAVGELLFAAVALARRLRVNPEDALRRRSTVFADRYRALERELRSEGRDLHAVAPEEWRERWERTAD